MDFFVGCLDNPHFENHQPLNSEPTQEKIVQELLHVLVSDPFSDESAESLDGDFEDKREKEFWSDDSVCELSVQACSYHPLSSRNRQKQGTEATDRSNRQKQQTEATDRSNIHKQKTEATDRSNRQKQQTEATDRSNRQKQQTEATEDRATNMSTPTIVRAV